MKPKTLIRLMFVWGIPLFGCNSPLIRSQGPEPRDLGQLAGPEQDDLETIGDITVPLGLNYLRIEGVAVVSGLNDTGSDPPPSGMKNALIGDIQSRDAVRNPEQFLASKRNAMVVVKGFLPPGVAKGDPFDIEIILPPQSQVTSLRGGFLMPCRLREMRVLKNEVHTGHISGLGEGDVLVESLYGGKDDPVLELQGRVLGGGQSQITRPLGLAVRGNTSVRQSAKIGAAINARFFRLDRGGKRGVATPKRDNYIELSVPSRYKRNLNRYVRVIRAIALDETPGQRVVRTESLERQLLDPITCERAALQLESIGVDAQHVLLRGLASDDADVRFCAAESLAYLDVKEAAHILGEVAESQPALRWRALTALAAMDHLDAYESLTDLLQVDSAETRYGAFRSLRYRNAADPLVRGEALGGGFAYHVINSDGPAMIHFSKSVRPEIVLFGSQLPIEPPAFLFAGKNILIKGLKDGQLKVCRFGAGQVEDLSEICPATVDRLVRAVVKMGGNYGDLLEALQDARSRGYLHAKVAINAVPRPDRPRPSSDDGKKNPDGGVTLLRKPAPESSGVHAAELPEAGPVDPLTACLSDRPSARSPFDPDIRARTAFPTRVGHA